ncbi:MAG: hypothetical protein PHY09_10015 [Desulfuromonadaceae bacterium]|nr:hypothetical protein [Desulfuromonadaceae bacterium]MDD5104716.1 hypothetical protein [Desulfuromonadaceae bacterium]
MEALALTITGLTVILVLSSATKFNQDWQAIRECCEFGDFDQLDSIRNDKQQWIMRHMTSAILGFGFVA